MGFPQRTISEQLKPALLSLLQASDYARECGANRWQFAVDLSHVLATGATLMDIRWLIHSGFAEHAKETTIPGDPQRSFRPLALTAFPADTCLVLTTTGSAELHAAFDTTPTVLNELPLPLGEGQDEGASFREVDSTPQPSQHSRKQNPTTNLTTIAPSSPPPAPEWDASHRELRYQGQVIKRFRVPAANQEIILATFQDDGWPHCIDDPLPQTGDIDPKQRLQATIKSLNRNQLVRLIRFHGNGNGAQVYWEAIAKIASTASRRRPSN